MDPWPPWPSHCTSSHPSWLHLMATLSTAYRAVHAQQLPDSFGAALALTPFASLTGISFVNPYNTTCACACAYTCVNPHLGWLSPSNGTQEGCSTYSGHVTEFVRTNSVRVPNMCCSLPVALNGCDIFQRNHRRCTTRVSDGPDGGLWRLAAASLVATRNAGGGAWDEPDCCDRAERHAERAADGAGAVLLCGLPLRASAEHFSR